MVKRKSRKKTTKGKGKTKPKPKPKPKEKPAPEPEKVPETPPTTIQKPPRREIIPTLSINDFPQKGELVVGTCTRITPHGAYFQIEGYEKLGKSTGFVHISELSRTWVRNIRKFIKEGQRTVLRVMRVNPDRQEIDLSKRRVNEAQRRETLQAHKQEQRARGIIKAVGERFDLSSDIINETLFKPLESNGTLYAMLEATRDEGSKILIDAGISEEIAEELAKTAAKELERPSVTLTGKATISTYDPAGMSAIKLSFDKAIKKVITNKATDVSVLAISAPDYKINLNAEDWKQAEKCWDIFQNTFNKTMKKETKQILSLEFTRE
ncbi:MAG: S1 RNA-binding domain-containing protein [Candidatus Hodarchaeales archaeon]